MIHSHDRSYYIGASDTRVVVGNWNTKSFDKWWGEKQGFIKNDFTNDAMMAGTAYEHKIIDALNVPGMKKDQQVIKGRLRVNLDGNTDDKIYEIKTYKSEVFKMPKYYIQQVNVEMYAFNIHKAEIVAYQLTDAEYNNWYLDIDPERLQHFEIEYDEDFINNVYLPRFNYLSECLDKGVFPNEQGMKDKAYE